MPEEMVSTTASGVARTFLMVGHTDAGSYVPLLKLVVCMKMHTNSS